MNVTQRAPRVDAAPIAIVGIGCRFPGGADSAELYWRNLAEGRLSMSEVPADRWSIDEFYHPVPGTPGKSVSKWGGFLDDIAGFEPEMFGISPREARFMDPQQRLLLEVAWEAIEDAGWNVRALAGTETGVFVGISISEYGQLQGLGGFGQEVDPHVATGGALSIAANRISYCLDLRGPSVSVDTACSSSLVAVDIACRRLRQGDCEVALAGGVNIMITPAPFVAFSAASMLSPDGRCKAFDATANGFSRGEGVGLVALKPLAQAETDGDPIYAVILASDTNQDGRTSGIALPNGASQAALVERVCRQAGVVPSVIDYMEAHGTGTAVGDPIEARALGEVLGRGRDGQEPCLLGSVKANIGHLESGAGIAGLIKATLVLQKRQVPPHLLMTEPNPAIPFEAIGLRLPLELEELPQRKRPLLAAVNSFGFGGTNAHAVLQEYRRPANALADASGEKFSRPYLLPLSARTEEALAALAGRYTSLLDEELSLGDLCFTASRRAPLDQRLVAIGQDRKDVKALLKAFAIGERLPGHAAGTVRKGEEQKLVFAFSGQGPQWWGMARGLLEREPQFRRVVEDCDRVMSALGEWSLLEELSRDEEGSRIGETKIAQPAIFALQAGLYSLLHSWNIKPDVVVGHSIGEIAAAHAAGVYSLEEAARLAFIRGDSMDRASSKGRMLAANITAEEAQAVIKGEEDAVSIAARNGPRWTVLAGRAEAMERVGDALERREVFMRWLQIDYAFHSILMEPIREELLERLSGLEGRPAKRLWISSVTTEAMTGPDADACYWWRNVRECVNYSGAFRRVLEAGPSCSLELSPHPALTNAMMETLEEVDRSDSVIPTLRRGENDGIELGRMIGQLWIGGFEVDWRAHGRPEAKVVRLPGYPWQREAYWNEMPDTRDQRIGAPSHPLLGRRQRSAQPTWRQRIDCRVIAYLVDHQVNNLIVFPAAGFLEMMLAVATEVGASAPTLEEVRFRKVLHLPQSAEGPLVEVRYDEAVGSVEVYSGSGEDGEWVLHASGYIRATEQMPREAAVDPTTLPGDDDARTSDDIYDLYESVGIQYGPAFHGVRALEKSPGRVLGKVRLPDALLAGLPAYYAHPALLDACFQLIGGLLNRKKLKRYLPVTVGCVRLYESLSAETWAEVQQLRQSPELLVVQLRLYGADGKVFAVFDEFALQATGEERATDLGHLLYRVRWFDAPLLEAPEESALPPLLLDEIKRLLEADEQPLFNLDGDRGTLEALVESNLEAHRHLDRVALLYFWKALGELGLPLVAGEGFSVAEVGSLPVDPTYSRLLGRMLSALASAHHLVREGSSPVWRVTTPAPSEDIRAIWREGLLRYPSFVGEFTLLARFGRGMARVMKGEADPVSAMFPDGSMTLAEQVYQDSPSFYLFNRGIAKIVEHIVAGLPPGRRVRILEVGGGTGGLTAHVSPSLPAHRCSYVFTDISRIFFAHVERKLRGYDFIDYQTLDIETDPAEQGFDLHSFDIVLASDVLHATKALRSSLANIKALLRPRGVVAFLEVDRDSPFMDCVFGQMPGWWRFEDHDLRPDYPLLNKGQWVQLLKNEGFEDVQAYGSEVEAMQLVLWARAPWQAADVAAAQPQPEFDSQDKAPGGASSWLIFADDAGIGVALARALQERGDLCVVVRPGESFERLEKGQVTIRPEEDDDYWRLVHEIEGPFAGIVHLWSVDADDLGRGLDALVRAELLGGISIMHCVQAMETLEERPAGYRFLVVTRGAQCILNDGDDTQVLQATTLGTGRVLINEMADVRGKLVDLAPDADASSAELVLSELLTDDAEEEVAIRRGARWSPRLERDARAERDAQHLASGQRFRLEATQPGVLDRLAFVQEPRPGPGPGEIEIEVRAASLNFRDVLKALDLYPKDSPDVALFGDECSGYVIRVGEGVSQFAAGDAVVAFAAGSLASHVVLPAEATMHKAANLDLRAAATMPVAFLTAYYALLEIGRLGAGESVLIHSATGGVGLAALQVAAEIGADVLATAGSQEKRDILDFYGIEGALNSRSLDFADQVMEATGGRGVDLVLNSLSGRAIAKGLSCLAPYGRFIEIGKRDIYEDGRIGLWPFHKNISFSAVDLGEALSGRRGGLERMVKTLTELIDEARLRPLPYRCFPASRIHEAIKFMSQAKHVGKVVIAMNDRNAPVLLPCNPELGFDSEASYLITGGFGGMGLALADWIVERGARSLALVGRRGAADEGSQAKVETLRNAGILVLEAKVDVTSQEEVQELVSRIRAEMPPLKGVFHTAMVLDDGTLLQLSPKRYRKVTRPKVAGAWNLHEATKTDPLEHFVLFSSMSSLIGQMGQANYAAANSMLDALAHYRRAKGLPALVMNFGAIKDVGILARSDRYSALAEFSGISSRQALSALAAVSNRGTVQRGVLRADWKALAAANPSGRILRRVRHLVEEAADQTGIGGGEFRVALMRAPKDERMPMLLDYLRELVGRVIGMSGSKIAEDQALNELGLDSLMALEMRSRIEGDLAITLPLAKLMRGPIILGGLGQIVMEQIAAGAGHGAKVPAPAEQPLNPLFAGAVAADRAASLDQLVTLKPGGATPPLFCFHQGGGQLDIYEDLAGYLASGLTLVGIKADPEARFASVEATAESYLPLLRGTQPAGPYRLFGFSLGGFIALETAALLEREGEEVTFVGIVDAKVSAGASDRRAFLANALFEIEGELRRLLRLNAGDQTALEAETRSMAEELLALPEEAQFDRLFAWVRGRVPAGAPFSESDLRSYMAMLAAHVVLAGAYRPASVSAPVYTWHSTKRSLGLDETDWAEHTSTKHVGRCFEVTHFELMRPPIVETIAAEISEALSTEARLKKIQTRKETL